MFQVLKWLPGSSTALAVGPLVLTKHVAAQIRLTATSTAVGATPSPFERDAHDEAAAHVALADVFRAPGIGVAGLISQATSGAARAPVAVVAGGKGWRGEQKQ